LRKLISLILALGVSAAVLGGCAQKGAEETSPSDAANDGEIYVKVGDYTIGEDDIDFYVQQVAANVQEEVGTDPGWEEETVSTGDLASDAVIETALDSIHSTYAMILHARDEGLFSEAEEESYAQELIDGQFNSETGYDYDEWLEENNFNDSAVRHMLGAQGSYMAVLKSYCTEEDAEKAFEDEYMCVKHILIQFESDGTGDDDTATYEKAKAAYDRAMAGLDVDAGYVFTDGEMVEEFETASKALAIGEISEPVKTSYGYHVIKRYALPEKGTESYDSYVENVRLTKGSEAFNAEADEKQTEWEEKYPLTVPDGVKEKIDVTKLVG